MQTPFQGQSSMEWFPFCPDLHPKKRIPGVATIILADKIQGLLQALGWWIYDSFAKDECKYATLHKACRELEAASGSRYALTYSRDVLHQLPGLTSYNGDPEQNRVGTVLEHLR